jgi:hypothetical protein
LFGRCFFSNRAERDLRRVDHLVDVRSRFGLLTGLGQQPGDIVIGLPSGVLVDFAFHRGEARRVGGQTFEPLVLAFGQRSSGLLGHGGR